MARPRKQGLSYFPHDVDASDDPKVCALRTKFGNDGYVFYFIMLEQVYKTEDGRLRSHAEGASPSSSAIQDEMFRGFHAQKCGVTPEKWAEILAYSVGVGLFDETAWTESKHLTSAGIQRRLGLVTEERERKRKEKDKGKWKDKEKDKGKVNASGIIPSNDTGETPEKPRNNDRNGIDTLSIPNRNPSEQEPEPEPQPQPEPQPDPQPQETGAGAPHRSRKNPPIEYSEDFEAWRKTYPPDGRRAKGAAFKAWRARIAEGMTIEQVMDATRNYSEQVKITGQIVMHDATFLGREKGWENYLTGTYQKPESRTGAAKQQEAFHESTPEEYERAAADWNRIGERARRGTAPAPAGPLQG